MLKAEGYFDGNSIQTFGIINAKKNQKVVITFLDEYVTVKTDEQNTARGILSAYAKPDIPNLRELEEEAWKEAANEKNSCS